MRIVRLGLALAAMASAPFDKLHKPAEIAASILSQHSTFRQFASMTSSDKTDTADEAPPPKLYTVEEAADRILSRYSSFKRIAFVGDSYNKYKDDTVVARAFAEAVSHCKDENCVVIAGATPWGIGLVHYLAHEARIPSLAIVSSRILDVDQPFPAQDALQEFAEQGGDRLFVIRDSGEGSSKSEVLVSVSNHMVGVGGDAVSAFEMMRFGEKHFPFSKVAAPKFWPAQRRSQGDGVCHMTVIWLIRSTSVSWRTRSQLGPGR